MIGNVAQVLLQPDLQSFYCLISVSFAPAFSIRSSAVVFLMIVLNIARFLLSYKSSIFEKTDQIRNTSSPEGTYTYDMSAVNKRMEQTPISQ